MKEHGTVGPDSPFVHLSKPSTWRPDGTCSFCGSISEETFFKAIEDGVVLGTTDKNYKVYVRTPNLPHGKFYFQHMSVEGRAKLIQLMNDGKVRTDMNDRWPVLPYFIVRDDKSK
jgi:hypothetical protein